MAEITEDILVMEAKSWEMMSTLNSKKCGCCKGQNKEMCRVNLLLSTSIWEKVNRPDRFVSTIQTAYFLLKSIEC